MSKSIYWAYLKYVLEHKKNVFIECWKDRLFIHAFTHDLSKLTPKEFIPYAKWFYGCDGIRVEEGYNKDQLQDGESVLSRSYLKCKANFKKAAKIHQTTNKHHWDYWIDEYNHPVIMPHHNIRQMICDWKAMGRKFGDTAQDYYFKNRNNMNLHHSTRFILEFYLNLLNPECFVYIMTLKDYCDKYGLDIEEEYEKIKIAKSL